jgi:hypothetical protein
MRKALRSSLPGTRSPIGVGVESRAFEHVPTSSHSRNNAVMHGNYDGQLLTPTIQNIDMRRSSTKSRMSSSFRYDLCNFLPCLRFWHAYLQIANYRTMILQRNLNNAFAYDLVPSPSVLTAALKAARRVNDYPTAVRIFEGMYLAAA